MPPMYKYSSIFLCNLFLVSNRLFVQPKAKHLSFRKIPMKQFRLLGRVSLVLSIILALMVVPTTITMASAYRALSNDYALWESLTDAVSISYNDVDGLYTEEWQPKVESFFAEMADKDNLCLSIAIDREILLDKGEMGKYDHIWLSQTEHSSYSNISGRPRTNPIRSPLRTYPPIYRSTASPPTREHSAKTSNSLWSLAWILSKIAGFRTSTMWRPVTLRRRRSSC